MKEKEKQLNERAAAKHNSTTKERKKHEEHGDRERARAISCQEHWTGHTLPALSNEFCGLKIQEHLNRSGF